MEYGPFMKTHKGEKNRIKDEYYWLKKKNGYVLKKWNGNTLWDPEKQKNYKNGKGKIIKQKRLQKLIQQNKNNENIMIKNAYGPHRKLPEVKKRIKGATYINKKGEERYWDGRKLKNKEKDREYRNRSEVKERAKIKREERRKKNPYKDKEYYQMHKERINKRNRENYHKNKEERKKKAKEYRSRPGNKEKASELSRKWSKKRRDEYPLFKLKGNLRHRVWTALKSKKKKKTLEYTCCTFEHLRGYLESQFTDGMNWESYGTKSDGTQGWQVDHRRPCCSFDFNNKEEIFMCFHWTNLQPLWAPVNQWEKGGKFDPETFEYEWKGREIGWKKIIK